MIRIRGHHILCIRGFQGYGYSKEFEKNMGNIVMAIAKNENIIIRIVDEADDICIACPKLKDGKCELEITGETNITSYDRKIIETLGLNPGKTIPAGELDRLVSEIFTSFETIEKIGLCSNCGWKEICKFYDGLRRINRKDTGT